MRVIIAGSRSFEQLGPLRLFELLEELIVDSKAEFGIDVSEVVSGCARGVDKAGEAWAVAYNVPIKRFHADWTRHGRAAGPIRNKQMAEYGEALICLWDGTSKGTLNMMEEARKRGLISSVKVYPEVLLGGVV